MIAIARTSKTMRNKGARVDCSRPYRKLFQLFIIKYDASCSFIVYDLHCIEVGFLMPTFSVKFSLSVLSNSLWHHRLQNTSLPCPSPPLPELAQIHVHRVGDAIQQSHPLLSLLLLPSNFSSIRAFSNESLLPLRWPKYWSFSFSISPSNEYSGLVSFRIDWFELLAVQGTFKSLLQHQVQKHQLFNAKPSYSPYTKLEKP